MSHEKSEKEETKWELVGPEAVPTCLFGPEAVPTRLSVGWTRGSAYAPESVVPQSVVPQSCSAHATRRQEETVSDHNLKRGSRHKDFNKNMRCACVLQRPPSCSSSRCARPSATPTPRSPQETCSANRVAGSERMVAKAPSARKQP